MKFYNGSIKGKPYSTIMSYARECKQDELYFALIHKLKELEELKTSKATVENITSKVTADRDISETLKLIYEEEVRLVENYDSKIAMEKELRKADAIKELHTDFPAFIGGLNDAVDFVSKEYSGAINRDVKEMFGVTKQLELDIKRIREMVLKTYNTRVSTIEKYVG